jgi:hypothetical protein
VPSGPDLLEVERGEEAGEPEPIPRISSTNAVSVGRPPPDDRQGHQRLRRPPLDRDEGADAGRGQPEQPERRGGTPPAALASPVRRSARPGSRSPAALATSMGPPVAGGRAGSMHTAAAATPIPTGTLMRKRACQPKDWVSAPPTRTPTAPPLVAAAVQAARAVALGPSRKMAVIRDSAAGRASPHHPLQRPGRDQCNARRPVRRSARRW